MSFSPSDEILVEPETVEESIRPTKAVKAKRTRNSRKAGVTHLNDDYALDAFVTKSNSLIQKTKYALPKLEQKILLAMISQINPRLPADPDKTYTLSFSDFSRLANVDMTDTTYINYLKATIKSLEDRSFWSLDANSDGSEYTIISWLQRGSKVNVKEKKIKIRFSAEILPYLTQLKSNYTSYNVEYLLMMNSTYSMRFYEIMLSYDNGTTDYGYANGLTFQPVTAAVLAKFPDKAAEIKGYKYKVFDIQELKEQLSPPPDKDKRGRDKNEKSLAEKYPNFSDFERYVLLKAKREINEMTDLWFDYAPFKLKGYRKFTQLYLFIKYKTEDEMNSVKELHAEKKNKQEGKSKRNKRRKPATETNEIQTNISEPQQVSLEDVIEGEVVSVTTDPVQYIPKDISQHTKSDIIDYLSDLAHLEELLDSFSPDLQNAITSVFSYVAYLLKATSSVEQEERSEETRNALNRVIKKHNDLQSWTIGMAKMLLSKISRGEMKSPQYYATVIFNMIDNFTIYELGEEELRSKAKSDFWLSAFDE